MNLFRLDAVLKNDGIVYLLENFKIYVVKPNFSNRKYYLMFEGKKIDGKFSYGELMNKVSKNNSKLFEDKNNINSDLLLYKFKLDSFQDIKQTEAKEIMIKIKEIIESSTLEEIIKIYIKKIFKNEEIVKFINNYVFELALNIYEKKFEFFEIKNKKNKNFPSKLFKIIKIIWNKENSKDLLNLEKLNKEWTIIPEKIKEEVLDFIEAKNLESSWIRLNQLYLDQKVSDKVKEEIKKTIKLKLEKSNLEELTKIDFSSDFVLMNRTYN